MEVGPIVYASEEYTETGNINNKSEQLMKASR
jgi:hypothetical protein